MMKKLKKWAKSIKYNVYALVFAARHDRTPLLVKIFAVAIAAYALSPIDLIPDFIPIVGYLDDLLLLPLCILLVIKLIPRDVWEECKLKAQESAPLHLPDPKLVRLVIFCIWSLFLAVFIWNYLI